MRQTYSYTDLQTITDAYSHIGRIRAAEFCTSGYENTNYIIQAAHKQFALKIFEGEGMSQEQIAFELLAMEASAAAGVKTPHVYRNRNNGLLTMCALDGHTKYAIVMDVIQGEVPQKSEIPDAVAREVGEETGKMDVALSVFRDGSRTRQNYPWDLKHFLTLEQTLPCVPAEYDPAILRDVFVRFRNIRDQFLSCATGLIHNDIALHNILVQDGHLQGIVDFSDMAWSPYIQNIAVPMSQMFFFYNWQPHQARLFVDGYRRYRPLSPAELSLLYDLTLARYATVVIEFSHWNSVYGQDESRAEWVHDSYGFMKQFLAFGKERFDALFK